MKKIIIASALLAAGCAPTSQLHLSAGRVGCSPKDIVVSDTYSSSHSETWSATCHGQTWFCSSTDEFREVMCKPQLKVAAPAPAAAPVVMAPAPAPVMAPIVAPVAAPPAMPIYETPPPVQPAPAAVAPEPAPMAPEPAPAAAAPPPAAPPAAPAS